jgi:hypothetical protein
MVQNAEDKRKTSTQRRKGRLGPPRGQSVIAGCIEVPRLDMSLTVITFAFFFATFAFFASLR